VRVPLETAATVYDWRKENGGEETAGTEEELSLMFPPSVEGSDPASEGWKRKPKAPTGNEVEGGCDRARHSRFFDN
jgi:hypothetical protein